MKAWESKRQFEALASEKALDAERRLRSEEAARAQREMEQLRFALAERDKQLAEKIAVIEAKEDEALGSENGRAMVHPLRRSAENDAPLFVPHDALCAPRPANVAPSDAGTPRALISLPWPSAGF